MSHLENRHLSNSVIMVQPIDFGYNEQTSKDNEFQHRPSINELKNINHRVNAEFEETIQTLQALGIETLILGKDHTDALLPDAIFPNNWFSTTTAGDLHIFPMKTKNRQDEVQTNELSELVNKAGYHINQVIDLRKELKSGSILEGTGSIIFHRPSNTIFAAISERCQQSAIEEYASRFGYQLVIFTTTSNTGSAIYHTNVLMSCGEDFVLITNSIVEEEKRNTIRSVIEENVGTMIIITEEQMTNHFCGNILQLLDQNQQSVIALSHSAYIGFTTSQKKFLESKGSLAVCKIPTIEHIGGGSIRCMLAENFLPNSAKIKKRNQLN